MDQGRDWAERTLCDDGACTGIIGGDGLCRVCGRPSPFWGDERRRGLQDVAGDDDDDPAAEAAAPIDRGPGAVDDDRQLCVDGGCVGLVGDNGRCKVCGLPGPGAGSVAAAKSETDTDTETVTAAADRRLCPDGACVGVLDDSGVCKVCGHSLAEN